MAIRECPDLSPAISHPYVRFRPAHPKASVDSSWAAPRVRARSASVAALDAGRMRWSDVPLWVAPLGYALTVGGVAVMAWAQAVNPFFEPGVRIQRERGQRTISNGPYRFIRHPGYAAAIVMFVGIPPALASWWGLIPGVVASALLVVRTALEDRLLRAQLPGYPEYAKKTQYRLAPGVW